MNHSKLRKFFKTILVFFLFSPPVFCQNETNNWILGATTGITFKSGKVEKFNTGPVPALSVKAIMSDSDGNLLFYTDGKTIWNKIHQPMDPGIGIENAGGNVSCSIVPKPGDSNKYYVFSAAGNNWGAPFSKIHFSEVDLCLNNGLGGIVLASRNTPLMGIASIRSAAVKHANGTDYWIAFHKWNSNAFYCYLVTSDGVNPTPVISNAGSFINLSPNSSGDGGQMKFSADGRKLGMAVSQHQYAEVFDFNSLTGQISNPIHIPKLFNNSLEYAEGLEFSPNGQLLYLTKERPNLDGLLIQFDLSAGNTGDILDSKIIIAGDPEDKTRDDYSFCGLQLASNGKLYVIQITVDQNGFNSVGISEIAKPNEKGANCQLHHDIVYWDYDLVFPNIPGYFPSFVSSYFIDEPTIQSDFNCLSPTVSFNFNYAYSKKYDDIQSVEWSFDDPGSGQFNNSNLISPTHTFVLGGPHRVTTVITWKDGSVSELVQLLTIPDEIIDMKFEGLGSDTTLCPGTNLLLDASKMGGNLTWSDGSSKSYLEIDTPGVYWVNSCRSTCSATDSIKVTMRIDTNILGNDTTLCDTKELVINTLPYGEVLSWQDNSQSPVYTIDQPGEYWVRLLSNDCVISDTLSVSFCKDAITIPNVITPNGDGRNDRFKIIGLETKAFSLTILNRSGKENYFTTSYKNEWNGNGLPAGTYYYYLQNNSNKESYKGWIQLIR